MREENRKHDRGSDRRGVLSAALLAGAGAALPTGPAHATTAHATTAHATTAHAESVRPNRSPAAAVRVARDDPRYDHLVSRGANRFRGTPDEVRLVESTAQTVDAVRDAVRAGRRIAVRSGGHCFEDFVDHPGVRTLIDMSRMRAVFYDPVRHAFAVEAGATLGEVYRALYLGWGVTVPGGYCPGVGAGGHVPGGGYGPLCRLFGLVSDHLYAVETVVVDRSGRTRSVIATRERTDPNRELWWAHTGGGGGSFGVATRYWFRSPGTTRATPPEKLLPAPSATALTFTARWDWKSVDRAAFTRLVDNFGRWAERHSSPGAEECAIYDEFILGQPAADNLQLFGQIAAAPAAAERLLREHIGAVSEGTVRPASLSSRTLPWLTAALRGSGEGVGDWRVKIKSGYARRRLTERQTATVHRWLTRTDTDVFGSLSLNTYGGQVNAVASGATAAAQRDSVLKLSYLAIWKEAAQDAAHLAWLREFYREMYAETGGVPVPGEVDDGAFINYPDVDLADPRWNTSGTDWQTLYFKGNAARLRAVKARWDPRGIFRHALAVPAD
ncbi:FAD-binding protein [Streptomyces jumonjinensis]|uniref:FAD-binding oxidoreductase n=1 Tax=Streptomyces jumonjinensis TaxID=1945 RepID=A0A646KK63_STRJU|nr:FAD-binding protein [Streptomyces jumonjinensis]MQT01446.1 FAD-binding oxidoreductase [Streptomyces jumonjinensis]